MSVPVVGEHGTMRSSVYRTSSLPPPLLRRRAFAWRTQSHPLIQHRQTGAPGSVTFRSPVTGALIALVRDHVLHGHIVLPGAAYLEMARAGCCAARSCASSASSAVLEGVVFVQPLVLNGEAAPAWVECTVSECGSFEVRSAALEVQPLPGAATTSAHTHCTGSRALAQPGAHGALGCAAERGRNGAIIGAAALYATYRAVGLEYGTAFRTLEQLWAAAPTRGTAWAALSPRVHAHGTGVHPADLDGALQLGALLARAGEEGSETQLPFAVEVATMCATAGELWAVRTPWFVTGALV